MNYFVYSFKRGRYQYERTCGTKRDAERRVEQYGEGAVYLVNATIHNAFY